MRVAAFTPHVTPPYYSLRAMPLSPYAMLPPAAMAIIAMAVFRHYAACYYDMFHATMFLRYLPPPCP